MGHQMMDDDIDRPNDDRDVGDDDFEWRCLDCEHNCSSDCKCWCHGHSPVLDDEDECDE